MWKDLLRVDWSRLTHAYGRAQSAPLDLLRMISPDKQEREGGWDNFWAAINHQGDYYDSTVAAIPFLVEAVGRPEVPDRQRILQYFRDRWLEAPVYGGDPILPEPPGGIDEPTPLLTEAEFQAVFDRFSRGEFEVGEEDEEEEDVCEAYRSMDLCAWQTGRAIQAARPIFEDLLNDPDPEVASAAASLLLLWPETRPAAKRVLREVIRDERDPVRQAERVLDYGVYGTAEDTPEFEEWTALTWPATVRAAAALAWAWVVDPAPLPAAAAAALRDASEPASDAFVKLPWTGVWHRGPWILPANAAPLILRLADHPNDEVRWRAVQGLEAERETVRHLSESEVVPVLVRRLTDRSESVRDAAAFALSERGEAASEHAPDLIPALIRALDDQSSSTSAHAARLLAVLSGHLTPSQRAQTLASVDRAIARFKGKQQAYARFGSMWTHAGGVLAEQRGAIQSPVEWDARKLLAEYAFPGKEDRSLSPSECTRRLARLYVESPQQTLAAAIESLSIPEERNLAIGAARWLSTLGPAAEPALPALDGVAAGPLDLYARGQAATSAEVIRRSLTVEPEPHDDSTDRGRISRLAAAFSAETELAELTHGLTHPDPYVRAAAAELFARLPADDPHVSGIIPQLEQRLRDDASVEVGVAGPFEFEGEVYHWRRERRSPRAAAIRALHHLGWVPEGDGLLTAMIAEMVRPALDCAGDAAPQEFCGDLWDRAVAAVGHASADLAIRAARQRWLQARSQGTADPISAMRCEMALEKVIRRLSGRLVGYSQ
jgi:HEAT repeat protein